MGREYNHILEVTMLFLLLLQVQVPFIILFIQIAIIQECVNKTLAMY